jgi:Protein of unknown function (DUF3592)
MALLSPKRLRYWLPRVFLGLGVVILVIGVVLVADTARFVAGAERVTGEVIDLSRDEDDEGGVTFHPVVRFTTADGRTVEFVSPSGSSPPSHSEGDRVEVLYDPDDPQDAQLSGFIDLWLDSVVAFGIGVGFIVVSGFVLFLTRGRSKADMEWLRRHGRRVQGRSPRAVESILTFQDVSPFQVEAEIDELAGGQPRVVRSEDIWIDPAPYLKDRETVVVYIDPNEPERYFVDVSFLPREDDAETPVLAPGSVRPPP